MPREIEQRHPHASHAGRIALFVVRGLLLLGARSFASYAIEIEWWKELGQFHTWLSMLYYGIAPVTLATLLAFAALWITHARALKFAGISLGQHRLYNRISTFVLLLIGYLVAAAAIDTWTVVRFAGSRGLPAAATGWRDTIFDKPLSFYLFDLPFYGMLRGYVLALVIVAILLYWLVARGWQLRHKLADIQQTREIDPTIFKLEGGLESRFLRGAAVILLLALAVRFFLGRYEMVYNEHGTFLVGVDYVDEFVGLPLQWLLIGACFAAAAFVLAGRWILAACMALALVISFAAPRLVSALHVRPNEISLEKPYIQAHIHATLSAYGLEQRVHAIEFNAHPDAAIDTAQHKPLLDNVRLWDWQPYHDTITQRQALRTYYVFHDSDVDRYTIDGQYREVLLSPRELDISNLPDARNNWINPAFIYTHGYGLVLSEVSKMTSDGLPVLMIEDAPPKIHTESIKLTRPEIYYGEVTHEPVFVNTAEAEFNYPSGEKYEKSRYEGTGGFPISSFFMKLAAAVREGEPNIILTNYLTPNSRMMIRRKVRDRVQELAPFLEWDTDPYMVINDAGHLVWIIDGYTTSEAHPYSRAGPPTHGRRPGTPFQSVPGETKREVLFYADQFDSFFLSQKEQPAITLHFREFLESLRPDVVNFTHTLYLGIEMVRQARNVLPGAAIVYTLHEFLPICAADGRMIRARDRSLCEHATPLRCCECFPVRTPQEFFLRELFIKSHLWNVDAFVAPSQFLLDRYLSWGLPQDKFHLIENGRSLQDDARVRPPAPGGVGSF